MLSFKEVYLQYHKKLNPKLFENDILKSDVRKILLQNAREWIKFARIPDDHIHDIIFTGGNAQYNYTRYSDIDVHIVLDKSKIKGADPDLLEDYFTDKKSLWSITRHIKILGYPIEMYAQDISDNLVASGVYSLLHNKWIKKPVKGNYDFKHDDILDYKVESLISQIKNMIAQEYPIEEFKKLKDKIKDMRKSALLNGDEFSFDNLVFKSLRNSGILDKMNKYIQKMKDKKLSLESVDKTI